MMEYTLRNYVELGYLVINRRSSVALFTESFMLSSYEYHADLEKVAKLSQRFGMQVSEEGSDIRLKTVDEAIAQEAETPLCTFYHSYRYSFDDRYALIRLALAQKLLWGTDALNMDDAAEEIGYSRSSLRDGIRSARALLTDFNIDIISKPHYGLLISGNEFDKRRCLISISSNYDTRVIQDDIDANIIEAFRKDNYDLIGSIVSEKLSADGGSISSANRRKVIIYLIVQNARIKRGFDLNGQYSLDEKLLERITGSRRLRKISTAILKALSDRLHFGSYDENEIVSLMVILSSLSTFSSKHSALAEELYPDERAQLGAAIMDVLKGTWHFEFSEKTSALMQSVIDNIVICHHLGELRASDYRLQGKPGNVYGYPLISHINESIRTAVSDYYGYKAASSQIEGICEILYYHIEALKLTYDRPRIAIGCRGNEFEAELLLETVKREVSPDFYRSIETVDFISASEDNGIMDGKYDLMICDQKINADENVLALENFDFNFANIEYYLRYSRDLFAQFEKQPHFIERTDIDFLNLQQLQQCVSEIGSKLEIEDELIQNSFNYYSDINECRIIIIPLQKRQLFLSLGEVLNKNAGKTRKCLILAACFEPENIRLLSGLLRELVNNSRFFKAMMADRTFETANNHLNSVFR